MKRPHEPLQGRLQKAGLAMIANTAERDPEAPWFVKALLALAGWVAAILILGSIALGVAAVIDSSAASLVLGLTMLAGAYGLLRIPRNDFVEHLALAISLTGQLLVAWALVSALETVDVGLWGALVVLQAALVLMMPNFVHRVFSTFAATLAFHLAMAESGAPYLTGGLVLLVLTWLWLNEFRKPGRLRLVQALGYGLVLGLLVIQYLGRFGQPLLGWEMNVGIWASPWMGEVLAGAALLYLLWRRFQCTGHDVDRGIQLAAYGGVALLLLASLQAYGLAQGAVVLALGFAVSNRLLLGLGVVSLLFSISSYYYLLDVTLLTKAWTLLVLGLLMLATRWLMLRWAPTTMVEPPHE